MKKISNRKKLTFAALFISLILIFAISFVILKKQKVEKPLTESEEIEQKLRDIAVDKKSIYDESKIFKTEEYKDENLGVKIAYPEKWEIEKRNEDYEDENITYINLRKEGYLVNFYITDKNWSYDSSSGLIGFDDLGNSFVLLDQKKNIFAIPKLTHVFDSPPYNTKKVIFFNETDFKYLDKDTEIQYDLVGKFSYTGFIYNNKTGITIYLQSPKGEETLDEDIINEIYYILANVDFYYGM